MKRVAFSKEVWWNEGNMKGEAQGMGLRPRADFGRRNHNQRTSSGWSYLYAVAGAVLLALATSIPQTGVSGRSLFPLK